MQYLEITKSTTLADLNQIVGSRNVDSIIHLNQLKRVPNIGEQFTNLCGDTIVKGETVDWKRKSSILNKFAKDYDLFQEGALLGDEGWKLLDSLDTFPNMLKIPETIHLPDTVDVHGSGQGVPSVIYYKALGQLASEETGHRIDPGIFNVYSSSRGADLSYKDVPKVESFEWFPIPWGDVTLYSSLSGESVDFPVYPTGVSDAVRAEYATMPDIIYQYEPWMIYSNSGPRANTYTFEFHRDMWTGDHGDGGANNLIRFCQANCYPEYKGSAVNTSIVTLYIKGQPLIRGVLTEVGIDWSGPIARDGWYLMCKMSLTITEVSSRPLNFDVVRNKKLIG